ncbi:MAG: single-stranded DNA-binding protein [Thermomicrobiales bacterium]
MASFAKVTLFGNLGADPETKYTPSGAMVVELRLAVNPRRRSNQQGGDEAPPTWYRISAWDRLAERIDKLAQQGYIAKGRSLYVEGQLEPREYTANDGSTRISFDVTMSDFQFVGGDRQQENAGGQGGGYRNSGNYGGGGNYGNSSGGYGEGGNNRRSTFADDDSPSQMDDVPF